MASGALSAGELKGIRLSSGPIATRIVLDLDHPASHSLFELSDPSRIVIDLPATSASSSLQLPVPKGRVRSVRTGARPGGELRVVFDLTGNAVPNSFELPPEGGWGHRLVIDLSEPTATGARAAVPAALPAATAAAAGTSATTASSASVTAASAPARRLTQAYTGRDLVVVVDAGHGGRDPGATGPRGVREKDVVLEIAKRLAGFIDAQPGLKAVLVRSDDRFVALSDRVRIAREARADLFISIHADALVRGNAEGATVFHLDTSRASSETAKRLADRENAADLLGGVSISDKSDDLARILLDLSQGVVISKSIEAGESVIARLSSVTTMRKTTVEPGSFRVLTSPDIPSVFIESAYISNPREESNLRDPAFQNGFAHALFAGILDYFRTNSPPDSYLAHNPPATEPASIRHVIARGETLSQIAERYRISLRELRSTNQINGDVIRIGQVLTIPTRG